MQPHEFWQVIEPAGEPETLFSESYPALLPDGRRLRLPIRSLSDGQHGLASLIINQASFSVQDALATALAERLAAYRPEVVVGLPTLGLTLAALVAQRLGHARYVPLGTSRKFWYDETLSVPLSSITTAQEKRLYIDPRLLPLLAGRRVALIDDVISSGTSMAAALELLRNSGIEPVVLGAAMLQSLVWRDRFAAIDPRWTELTIGVLATPRLTRNPDGKWRAE
ncbi:MAG TPA: phosphoribosyltransferase [Devosiaceae bacterium]|jgi:adenine/guanine phosphoribosyltransferase-like PRPP-binding protein